MDVTFELGDYKFIWDSEKEKINRKKHKLSFKVAARVYVYEDYDEFHSDFEDRLKLVGKIDGILAVIYTEREDRNRIISARTATTREERLYYEQFHY